MKHAHSYSLALEALAELAPEINAAQADVTPILPSLDDVLSEPSLSLPREALFLGVADDTLPILLNLHDPVPGPLLIAADPGAGKTAFLQTVAHAIVRMHNPDDVQFGVLTSRPEDWESLEQTPHCVGVFSFDDQNASGFILSLGQWTRTNKSQQSVVLLVDDIVRIEAFDIDVMDTLRWLLLRGPTRHVWTIATLNPANAETVWPWMEFFRTRIFGKIRERRFANSLTKSVHSELDSLINGYQFAMLEGSTWLRFWIPRLGDDPS